MGDKGIQTKNTILSTGAIYSVSSLTGIITGITKWLASGITGVGLIGVIALIILATNYMYKAMKANGQAEYTQANQNALLGSLSSLGAAVLAFIL